MKPQNHERVAVKEIGVMWEIDDNGCVWRIGRKFCHSVTGEICIVPCDRKRAEYKMPNGYLSLQTSIGKKRLNISAHRLIWQYFFGDIPEHLEINHKNGLKDDNRPNNLELVTKSKNAKHALKLGLTAPPSDVSLENNPNAKMTWELVRKMRKQYTDGYSVRKLETLYPIKRSQIQYIIKGEKWQEMPEV